MNPMINQLMKFALGKNNILNMFLSVKNAQNPNQVMQNLMQSNPQVQEVMNFINQNGGNAKNLFYAAAKQKGADPNTIINYLNNQS